MRKYLATLATVVVTATGLASALPGENPVAAGKVGAAAAAADEPDTLQPAPDRRPDEGLGQFNRLVIRGATLIDGTGAPPRGPVDIVVHRNRITHVIDVAEDELDEQRWPRNADHEIDATGKYVTPGFVDMHVHGGGPPKNAEAEYPYKLWLAHGVTTVRGVQLSDNDFSVSEKQRSARNEIVAPRIWNYQRPGAGWDGGRITTPEQAVEWVKWAKRNGVDGLKLPSAEPAIMEALIETAQELDLGTVAHLDQRGVEKMDAITAARLGLDTVTHFYGHFHSLKRPGVEWFPPDYDYSNEQMRFSQVADWADKIYPVGGKKWKAYLREQLELGTVFDPTFNIYAASRDVMRMRNAEWHEEYTLPSLFEFFEPATQNHGSYYWDWTTEIETKWRKFYQVWFQLTKDYHDMGGRITTGSDSGFIYQTYGFGYIMELEMLREAGLTALEVMQAATLNGAKTLYEPSGKRPQIGTVERGKLADLLIMTENPLENFKGLYASGHRRLNPDTNEVETINTLQFTIKDGIVYDAEQLRADVRAMVDEQEAARGT